MKKSIAIALASALLASACGGMRTFYTEDNPRQKGYSLALLSPPNPTAPNVFIVNNYIVVDQEPIMPPPGDRVTIYFALEQDGIYKFQQQGIEIHQHPSFCAAVSDYVFKCAYSRPASGTIYKYTIRVRNSQTQSNLKDLDPTIWN